MIYDLGANIKLNDTLIWKIIFLEDKNKIR